jgi:hypothetical protein
MIASASRLPQFGVFRIELVAVFNDHQMLPSKFVEYSSALDFLVEQHSRKLL